MYEQPKSRSSCLCACVDFSFILTLVRMNEKVKMKMSISKQIGKPNMQLAHFSNPLSLDYLSE